MVPVPVKSLVSILVVAVMVFMVVVILVVLFRPCVALPLSPSSRCVVVRALIMFVTRVEWLPLSRLMVSWHRTLPYRPLCTLKCGVRV